MPKKIYPIFEDRYIEQLKKSGMEDSLRISLDYIDSIVVLMIKAIRKGDGQALIDITGDGFKGWKKICRRDIVVRVDDEGYEYLLEKQTYPDFIMNRFLRDANTKQGYEDAVNTLSKIFNRYKWVFTEPEKWEQVVEHSD